MKKYRIQKCLEIVKGIRSDIKEMDVMLNVEDKLRILMSCKRRASLIYNTMRSLHD
jgi:hypothetical protein